MLSPNKRVHYLKEPLYSMYMHICNDRDAYLELKGIRQSGYLNRNTVEPLNIGHFGDNVNSSDLFVLCREVVLFGKFKMNYYKEILGPQAVSSVERFIIVFLFGRIHYRRSHGIS